MKKNSSYQGGILFTAISLISLFCFIFLFVVEDYQRNSLFNYQTQLTYTRKILKELFLSNYPKLSPAEEKAGTISYTSGTVNYEKKATSLVIKIEVAGAFITDEVPVYRGNK